MEFALDGTAAANEWRVKKGDYYINEDDTRDTVDEMVGCVYDDLGGAIRFAKVMADLDRDHAFVIFRFYVDATWRPEYTYHYSRRHQEVCEVVTHPESTAA